MTKWLLIGVLVLAAAEIAALGLARAVMGLPQALILLFTTSLAGLMVLRWPGRAQLQRLRVAVTQSGIVGLEASGNAFLTVSAGILLLLPGFITDILGILLLLPAVRRWIGGRFRRFVHTHQGGTAAVVNLDPADWNHIPERALKDQTRKNDPP